MTQVGSVYAQALYSLAKEEGLSQKILEELKALDAAFSQETAFLRLLSTPSLSKEERAGIIDESFAGKVEQYVLNFMKILMEKGYMLHFPDCCKAYQNCYNEDNGIVPVSVVTAVPLTQEQSQRLREKLAKMTGKIVELECTVDPECLGGVRLDYDGKRVDDTLAHRLDALRNLLKNTIL